MLSLTRRSGEEIIIIDTVTGEQIIVAPTRNEGNQARIGIKAPRRFEILRREVLEQDGSTDPVWSRESAPAPSQYYLAPWPNQKVPSERAPTLWQD